MTGWNEKIMKRSGHQKMLRDPRGRPRPNLGRFWDTSKPFRKGGGFGDFWESADHFERLITKVISTEGVVRICVHRRGIDVYFGKNAQQQAKTPAVEKSRLVESAERLNSMQQAFKNEGSKIDCTGNLESSEPKCA